MEKAAEICDGVNIEKSRRSESAEEEVALELPECYIIRHKKLANTSLVQTSYKKMCEDRRTVMGQVDSGCGYSVTSPSEINCKWNKIRREELGLLSNSELMDMKTNQQVKCKMNDTCDQRLEMKMVQQRVESQGEEEKELRNLEKSKASPLQKLNHENVNMKWQETGQAAPKSVKNTKSIFSTIRSKISFGSNKQMSLKKQEKIITCANCNSLFRNQDSTCKQPSKNLDNGRDDVFLNDIRNVPDVVSKSCFCFDTRERTGKGKCQACNSYNPTDEGRAVKKHRKDKISSFGSEDVCSRSGNLNSEKEGATQVSPNFMKSFVTAEDECPSVRKIMAENRCTSQICICAGKRQDSTDQKGQSRILRCRPGIIPSPLKIPKEEHEVNACPNKTDSTGQQEKCITRQHQNEVGDDNFVDALFNTDVSADPWTIIFVPQQMDRILNVFNDKDICTVRNPVAIQWCNEMVQEGEAYNRPDLVKLLSGDFSQPLNQSTESTAGPETQNHVYKEAVDQFLKNEYDTHLLKDWHPYKLHTESVSTQTTSEPELPPKRTQSALVVSEDTSATMAAASKEEVVTEGKLSESKCYIDASTCMSRVLLPTINTTVQPESKASHEPDLIPRESIMDDIDCKESPVRSKVDLRSKFSYSFPFFS